MNKNKKETKGFDKDFLWLFRKIDRVAICASLDQHVVDLNDSAEILFSIQRKKALGQSVASLFELVGLKASFSSDQKKPILRVSNKDDDAKSPIAKKIFELDWEVKSKDGVDGRPVGFILFAQDPTDVGYLSEVYKTVTGQERADKAGKDLLIKLSQEITGHVINGERSPVNHVRSVQDYLENIISCMPGHVYWMDRNGTYLGCNNNVADFLKLSSRKEIVGLTHEDIEKNTGWASDYAALWKRDHFEVMSTGKAKLNIEEQPVLVEGKNEVFYLTSRVPIFDVKSNVVGVVGVSIDISDRKRLEKLQNEKSIAEKTSKLMQKLAGSIAHEVRTPLAIIGINIDLLARMKGGHQEENSKKCFKAIKYAIRLASRLIDNVLIIIRTLYSGKQIQADFQCLYMENGVEDVLEIYPFLDHERALIRFDRTKDFVYRGDKTLTQHMLFNLIKNALASIKEAGKGEIKIEIEKGKSENKLIFTDTALGISKEHTSKIFDQFETMKDVGFGLGLAFCKMIMRSYGGDITCESEVGKYAKFILRFPVIAKEGNVDSRS